MKKVINGKMYSTETATCVASWDNGRGCGDFNYIEESLYKKTTGEFFLHGEGGANTRYSRSCGSNSWCGGERIEPMSEKEAREWTEDHCSGDVYVEIFGEVAE